MLVSGSLLGLWLHVRQEKKALDEAWFKGLKDRPLVYWAIAEVRAREDNVEDISSARQRG